MTFVAAYNGAMTLTELNYIAALAQQRHFGRAALCCGVTQSALSMAVKQLEAELGVMIFERDRQGVRITPVGEQVLARAQKALEHCAHIQQLARRAQSPLAEPLVVGVCNTLAPYYLPRLKAFLPGREAAVALRLVQGNSARLWSELVAGKLDILLAGKVRRSPEVVARPLTDEPLVAVLPPYHPLAAGGSVPLSLLAGEQLILPGADDSLLAPVRAACPLLASVVNDAKATQMSIDTAIQAVSLTGGVALVPSPLAHPARLQVEGLIACPCDPPLTRTLSLQWRTGFTRPQDVDFIIETLTNIAATAGWQAPVAASDVLLVENSHW